MYLKTLKTLITLIALVFVVYIFFRFIVSFTKPTTNISLNQSEEKIFTEQNLTSKRNVKYFSKKSGKNSEKQMSLDIHQSVHDDIPYKNVYLTLSRISII
jgi:hypothetical protein